MQRPLQPGELTKPVRVWCTSTSIRIGWYQAEPCSENYVVFYKKSGSLFGTEIVLPTASLLGPDLSMTAPLVTGGGRAEYFELDIRKLKPNTQYVVKVRAEASQTGTGTGRATTTLGGDVAEYTGTVFGQPQAAPVSYSVRSDRLSTLGDKEEAKRNLDMGNFIGSLIKLGEYDGNVVSFDPNTGLYEVRILQVEEVGSAIQLVRLASEYSDLGLPARTYSLSSIRFGRWGGEISDSQVVGESELKWIVGRSVALAERTEAASNYSVREHLLQAQNENLANQMEAQRQAAVMSLAYTRRAYMALFAVTGVVCLLLVVWAWWAAWRRISSASQRVAAAGAEVSRLEAELRQLELYRMSLQLDTGAWISAAAAGVGAVRGRGGATLRDGLGQPVFGGWAQGQCVKNGTVGNATQWNTSAGVGGVNDSAQFKMEGGAGGAQAGKERYHPLLDVSGPLLDALRRKKGARRGDPGSHGGSGEGGRARHGKRRGRGYDSDDRDDWTDRGVGVEGEAEGARGSGNSAHWAWWPWGRTSQPQSDSSSHHPRSTRSQSRSRTGVTDSEGGPDPEGMAGPGGGGTWGEGPEDVFGPAGAWGRASVDPPLPWEYVNHAANLYSVYLNEWVKHQMAQSIRTNIHSLLEGRPPGQQTQTDGSQTQPGVEQGSQTTADTASSGDASGGGGGGGGVGVGGGVGGGGVGGPTSPVAQDQGGTWQRFVDGRRGANDDRDGREQRRPREWQQRRYRVGEHWQPASERSRQRVVVVDRGDYDSGGSGGGRGGRRVQRRADWHSEYEYDDYYPDQPRRDRQPAGGDY